MISLFKKNIFLALGALFFKKKIVSPFKYIENQDKDRREKKNGELNSPITQDYLRDTILVKVHLVRE